MKKEQKKEAQASLVLPENFNQKLAEIIDPHQSVDYQMVGGVIFPIEVLPISTENKIVHIGLRLDTDTLDNYEWVIARSVGEVVRYYNGGYDHNWIDKNASREEIEIYYNSILERQIYNDEIVSVVRQVINNIKWKPVKQERIDSLKKYKIADCFSDAMFLLNATDSIDYRNLLNHTTRGMLEIIKLNNMISNDRFSRDDKEKTSGNDVQPPEGKQTMEEYMDFLSKQGVPLASVFKG